MPLLSHVFYENHDVAVHNSFVNDDPQPQLIHFIRQGPYIGEENA